MFSIGGQNRAESLVRFSHHAVWFLPSEFAVTGYRSFTPAGTSCEANQPSTSRIPSNKQDCNRLDQEHGGIDTRSLYHEAGT